MKKIVLIALIGFCGTLMHAKEVTVSTATELSSAISSAVAGDIIWVNGGTYSYSTPITTPTTTPTPGITISKSGTADSNIKLYAVEGTRPVLNFSGQTRNSSSAQGIKMKGSYWHIKGLDIYAAGDNGMQIAGGHYNTIEHCNFFECNDSGLQIDNGSSYNLILNCDSYHNADATNENADGFACKLGAGMNNKFKGCRSWQNLDDGWDGYLKGTDDITTIYEDCWAFKNGYDKNSIASAGDGNGFKTGGSDDKTLKHNATYTRCISAGNRVKGFDHNSNRGNITLYNCAAYSNGTNMGFGSTNPVNILTIKNSVVIGTTGNLNATTKDISYNSWDSGVTATADDYESIDYFNELSAPRQSDGSLPNITFLKLKASSDLIDKGTNIGQTYSGTAPDLGPFEYSEGSAINNISSDIANSTVVSTSYYSLAGVKVQHHINGIVLVKKEYDNGLVTVDKVIYK